MPDRAAVAIEQIRFARNYLKPFLADLKPDEWFWMPAAGVSHVAWQVGHLAAAQYFLAISRRRGEQPADAELIAPDFRSAFGRGSAAQPAGDTPPVETIVATLDRVFQQVLDEAPTMRDEELDVPVDPPHPAFRTRLEALQFCSQHEMIHVGQIAIIRRLLGRPPLR